MTLDDRNSAETAIVSARELGVDPEALWQTADKLRGSIDAAEYKHVVLGLIFLKYISDAFEARRATLANELEADRIKGEQAERLLEDRDEYTAEGVFWVPSQARWANIQAKGKQSDIATIIDDARLECQATADPLLQGSPSLSRAAGPSPEDLARCPLAREGLAPGPGEAGHGDRPASAALLAAMGQRKEAGG